MSCTAFSADQPPPASPFCPTPHADRQDAAAAPLPRRALRVLLVEDNAHWCAELARLAAAGGHQVVYQCASADEASAWLAAHAQAWDLALIDAFLSRGNGFALLRQCRRVRPGQRVVMVSNYAREEARSQALRLGADRFFDKASELDALVAYAFAPQAGA